MKKCAHIGRTRPKNVRPAAEMCAPGAECTLNFEHCQCIKEIVKKTQFFEVGETEGKAGCPRFFRNENKTVIKLCKKKYLIVHG